MSNRITVMSSAAEVAIGARDLVAELAPLAIAARGVFHWALAGGSTPKASYVQVAALPPGAIEWARVHVWFGDERCVPPDHAESNWRMANEAMLSRVPIPGANVHRIEGERGRAAAARYEDALRAAFPGDEPTFDLALLGLGADGHTASLFAPGDLATDSDRLAVAVTAPASYSVRERISVTHHTLARARGAVFLVTGQEKRDVLARVLDPRTSEDRSLPASVVASACHTRWIVDRDASTA